ncbi:MAG: biopolymer transporter ExbD [Sphingobacteriaceae bacterium]|nr:biopolymer transporter ExbD [Sphingobacteriaceae bacterium]
MARAKVPRKSTAIDMTAMCDVAFLLLTFFILTATARQPDPANITTPTSTYEIKVPDKDLAILSIGHGKVFFEVIGQDIKRYTLEKMGETYGVTFSEEEKKRFAVLGSFGVPMNQLKNFINMNGEERTKTTIQTGIPTSDSTSRGELYQWVLQSRMAVAALHNERMSISIKGDSKEEYPTVRKIIDILQKQKQNKFSLITSPEGAPKK